MCFNLRIESLVIESNRRTSLTDRSTTVSISELRVLLLRGGMTLLKINQGSQVSISELRVLLLRERQGAAGADLSAGFNLRIESLVIERRIGVLGQVSYIKFQSQN